VLACTAYVGRRSVLAEARFFVCGGCGFEVEVWSDGNPYYRDERGRKRYAYHPDHENLARCVGNDEPHLCMACGAEAKIDSLKRITSCRKCKGGPLVPLWNLEGNSCPRCRESHFSIDKERRAIS
jgi:hypothetical protein